MKLNYPANHIFFNKVILYLYSFCKRKDFLHFMRSNTLKMELVYDKASFLSKVTQVLGELKGGAFSDYATQYQAVASSVLSRQFQIFGAETNIIVKGIWNCDVNNDYCWPEKKWYLKYKIGAKGVKADVKFPWELSRCHHLLWLGAAYQLNKEEKYALEIIDEINNWIDSNPFEYSVNWTCSMEVAIRCVNWLYAINMIKDSTMLKDAFLKKFQNSIYQHGKHIYENLEYSPVYNANHYYSNIIGLLYIGWLFDNTRQGKKWLSFAINEYLAETRVQFLPSGANFENTTSYHRLMTELAICGYYCLKRTGVKMPLDISKRLQKALEYVKAYHKPTGAPLIGDNDDGRFLPVLKRPFSDHSYFFDTNSPEMKVWRGGVQDDLLLSILKETSTFVSESGIAVLKKDGFYLMISNSEPSRYIEYGKTHIPTHTHNDKLSFVLSLNDSDIIVDPGTYVYTSDPKRRNEFRSTLKHNTVYVDDEEQNELVKNNVFAINKNINIESLNVKDGNSLVCEGAYTTIAGELSHERSFILEDNRLIIVDTLKKKGSGHHCISSFHLAQGMYVDKVGDRYAIITNENGDKYCIELVDEFAFTISVEDDTISPNYGVLVKTKTIRFVFNFDEIINMKYIIRKV